MKITHLIAVIAIIFFSSFAHTNIGFLFALNEDKALFELCKAQIQHSVSFDKEKAVEGNSAAVFLQNEGCNAFVTQTAIERREREIKEIVRSVVIKLTSLETYAWLALVGASGGLISGLVGLAGGIVIVPALMTIYGTEVIGDAIVVSFFAVLFNSLSTTIENLKTRGKAQFWPLIRGARWFTYGAIFAALTVAILFGQHKDAIPKHFLAALQLVLAACMLVPRSWYESTRLQPNMLKDTLVGSIVGGVSTLIGVGGGTYTIAYFMTAHGREVKDCTLTANFIGIFIGLMSLVGYYGYLAFALASHTATSHSLIDMAGTAVLVISGVAAGPIGVRLQKKLPAASIKKAIVLTLAASSCYVFGVA